jgi:hypothetical protein
LSNSIFDHLRVMDDVSPCPLLAGPKSAVIRRCAVKVVIPDTEWVARPILFNHRDSPRRETLQYPNPSGEGEGSGVKLCQAEPNRPPPDIRPKPAAKRRPGECRHWCCRSRRAPRAHPQQVTGRSRLPDGGPQSAHGDFVDVSLEICVVRHVSSFPHLACFTLQQDGRSHSTRCEAFNLKFHCRCKSIRASIVVLSMRRAKAKP